MRALLARPPQPFPGGSGDFLLNPALKRADNGADEPGKLGKPGGFFGENKPDSAKLNQIELKN